jgi:hypothetical protein
MSDVLPEIAQGIFRLTWGDDSLMRALHDGNERVMAKVYSTIQFQAPRVESHAKTNAPWTDQTGNARQGLRAEAFRESDNMGIVLYHQVPYGIWLELANGGKYAIIDETIGVMGPQVMASLERILEQI